MPDDLRTRIAAVLYERFATAMGFADAAWDDTEHETWLEDADAVIRELEEWKWLNDESRWLRGKDDDE